MKPLIPILIVATTSLAVASVQYAQQASEQRKRADAEVLLRQKQEVRIAELQRTQERLERELSIAQDAVSAPPAPVAKIDPPPTRAPARAGGAVAGYSVGAAGSAEPPQGAHFSFGSRPPEMSPAARKFMRSRMKASMKRTYEDVGPALGLSGDKANQLVELIVDQQTRNIGRPPPAYDPQNPQGMQQYFQEQQKKNQAEIASLIGQDKLDEWKSYQDSLPDRMQLNQVRDQLDNAGVPMTESQRTEMLAAISDERGRNPRPSYSSGVPREEQVAQMNQWQNDYDKALLDRARQVLTSEQYKNYKEYVDWQTEMRNSFRAIPGPDGRGFTRMGVFNSAGGNAVISAPGVASETAAATFFAVPTAPLPATPMTPVERE